LDFPSPLEIAALALIEPFSAEASLTPLTEVFLGRPAGEAARIGPEAALLRELRPLPMNDELLSL
jgi:hypothetical protein